MITLTLAILCLVLTVALLFLIVRKEHYKTKAYKIMQDAINSSESNNKKLKELDDFYKGI